MSTLIAILGGVGLFLLGMSVMTEGLKGLAGSALRALLARAAATPLRGTIWGAVVTMLVQSSTATTMTTIGLVSAGMLSFPQGLSVVFGANVGTTGTGWLVALLGVRFSLTATAMPLIFVGALMRLLGAGRIAASGSALAGFAVLLAGLTTLQEGMAGFAERFNPADLPAVASASNGAETIGWLSAALGVLLLVGVGVLMTAVMQSSSAVIAVVFSAVHAGAIGTDQAIALVIGANVGTSVSTSLAAIGTTTPAKRTAVGYILFKLVATTIALATFPIVAPMLDRASTTLDPVTLLAIYHTAFNVVGVAILLPLIGPFSRFVEGMIAQRGSMLTRWLDRSVLDVPEIAVEAGRRTVAGVLEQVTLRCAAALDRIANSQRTGSGAHGDTSTFAIDRSWTDESITALDEASAFLSSVAEPPPSKAGPSRLASTLHALDHTRRLVEAIRDDEELPLPTGDGDVDRAIELCVDAMRGTSSVAAMIVGAESPLLRTPPPSEPGEAGDADNPADNAPKSGESATPAAALTTSIERASTSLAELRRAHRAQTLDEAGVRRITARDAIARVEAVRQLDRFAYHAWRATLHLVS